MTMNKRILIIDGNNLAHRAQHKFNLTTAAGVPSSVVYGFIYVLNSMLKRFPSDQVIAVFDGGSHPERLRVLPGYKDREGRMDDEEHKAFISQLSFLRDILPSLGVMVAHKRFMEADDLIHSIVRRYPKAYKTIVSSDKDFVQLLGSNTKIYNPYKDAIISTLNCEAVFGYKHTESVDYLCLDGDKSDKIPGVPGMGPKRIREFLDEFESVEEYLESDNKGKWVKYPIEQVWKLNKKIIDLRMFYNLFLRKEPLYIAPAMEVDEDKVHSTLFRKYQVRLFSNPDVIKNFKNLNR